MRADELAWLDETLARLERPWIPERRMPPDNRRFPYIAYSPAGFVATMAPLYAQGCRSFLDVGCGIGIKLLLARMLGFETVVGVEIDDGYAAIAASLVPEALLVVEDAFDFGRYDEFDVIYSFHPCVDVREQQRLERVIAERARAGAVLYLPSGRSEGLGERLGVELWRVTSEAA